MKENAPTISVVIPTYQREEMLLNTVNDLLCQEGVCFEIIVVDQTEDSCARQKLKTTDCLKYIHVDGPNLTHALNLGWKMAAGEIILSLDDDIAIANKSFLKGHWDNYADRSIGAVAGAVFKPGQIIPSVVSPKFFSARLKWMYFRFDSSQRMETFSVPGANFSVRRRILEEIGGIDENFIQNAYHWELDAAYRIRGAGYKIIFDPSLKIVHYYGAPGGAGNLQRHQTNVVSHTYFYYLFRNSVYCFMKHEKKCLPYLLIVMIREYIVNRVYLRLGMYFFVRRWLAFCKGVWGGITCYYR